MIQAITVPQLFQVAGMDATYYPDEVRSLVCAYVHEAVRAEKPFVFPACLCAEDGPIDYEIAPKKPRLHRQVASYVYKTYRVKIPQNKLDELALAAANVLERGYFFDVVPHMNWQPGEYGENKSSCWWGSYWRSRGILFPVFNGHAIRAYHKAKDGKHGAPAGRAVLLDTSFVIKNSFVMTNVYGIEEADFSTVIKAMMREQFGSVHARKVSVHTNFEAYVNNNSGILYSPTEIPNHVESVSFILEEDPPTIPEWMHHWGRMYNVYRERLDDGEWVWVKTKPYQEPGDHNWVRQEWINNGNIKIYPDPRIYASERSRICI